MTRSVPSRDEFQKCGPHQRADENQMRQFSDRNNLVSRLICPIEINGSESASPSQDRRNPQREKNRIDARAIKESATERHDPLRDQADG